MEQSSIIKPIVAVVAIVLTACIAFGLFTCQSTDRSDGVAATVNGVAIQETAVTKAVQTLRTQSGLDDDDAWVAFLNSNGMTPESIREQIIGTLVNQELVEQGASEIGIVVDGSQIDAYIESMKASFGDDEAWDKWLEESGLTEESYRESVESTLLQQSVGSYFEEKAELTDADYVESAKTYASYYDGAKRSSHILFKVEDATDEAALNDARAEAQAVLDQIDSGMMSFEEAVWQYSDDSSKDNDGDMGWDRATMLSASYQAALDELEKDQVSNLVESAYGVHIIKCTDVYDAPEEVTSIDQVPADFQEAVKRMAASVVADNDYATWVEGLRQNADIVVNPMPADVPYNVDVGAREASNPDTLDG